MYRTFWLAPCMNLLPIRCHQINTPVNILSQRNNLQTSKTNLYMYMISLFLTTKIHPGYLLCFYSRRFEIMIRVCGFSNTERVICEQHKYSRRHLSNRCPQQWSARLWLQNSVGAVARSSDDGCFPALLIIALAKVPQLTVPQTKWLPLSNDQILPQYKILPLIIKRWKSGICREFNLNIPSIVFIFT